MNKISVVRNDAHDFLVNHDHWLETIPFAVIVQIFIKCVISTCLSDETVYKSHFLTYLKHKSYEHCLFFAIPVIGAVIGAIVYFVVFPQSNFPKVSKDYMTYGYINDCINKESIFTDQFTQFYSQDKEFLKDILKTKGSYNDFYNNIPLDLRKNPEIYEFRIRDILENENLISGDKIRNLEIEFDELEIDTTYLKVPVDLAVQLIDLYDRNIIRFENDLLEKVLSKFLEKLKIRLEESKDFEQNLKILSKFPKSMFDSKFPNVMKDLSVDATKRLIVHDERFIRRFEEAHIEKVRLKLIEELTELLEKNPFYTEIYYHHILSTLLLTLQMIPNSFNGLTVNAAVALIKHNPDYIDKLEKSVLEKVRLEFLDKLTTLLLSWNFDYSIQEKFVEILPLLLKFPNSFHKISADAAVELVLFDPEYIDKLDESILNDVQFWDKLLKFPEGRNLVYIPNKYPIPSENKKIVKMLIENKNLSDKFVTNAYLNKALRSKDSYYIRRDTELFFQVVKRDPEFINKINSSDICCFTFTSKIGDENLETIIKLLEIYGNLFEDVYKLVDSSHLKRLILAAAGSYPRYIYQYYNLPYDFDFDMKVIERNKKYLDAFLGKMQFVTDYSKLAINKPEFQKNLLDRVKTSQHLGLFNLWKSIDKFLTDDVEFVLKAIKLNPYVYEYLKDEFKDNLEFVLKAVELNHDVYDRLKSDFKKNLQIIKVSTKDLDDLKFLGFLNGLERAVFDDDIFLTNLGALRPLTFERILKNYTRKLRTENEFQQLCMDWANKNGEALQQIFGAKRKFFLSLLYFAKERGTLDSSTIDSDTIDQIPKEKLELYMSSDSYIKCFGNIIVKGLHQNCEMVGALTDIELKNKKLMDYVYGDLKCNHAKAKIRQRLREVNKFTHPFDFNNFGKKVNDLLLDY